MVDLMSKFGCLEFLRVLRHGETVDAFPDVTPHECRKIIDGIVYTVVSDTSLREIISADLCGAVAGADHGLSFRSDVIEVFLMLAVIDKGSQT